MAQHPSHTFGAALRVRFAHPGKGSHDGSGTCPGLRELPRGRVLQFHDEAPEFEDPTLATGEKDRPHRHLGRECERIGLCGTAGRHDLATCRGNGSHEHVLRRWHRAESPFTRPHIQTAAHTQKGTGACEARQRLINSSAGSQVKDTLGRHGCAFGQPCREFENLGLEGGAVLHCPVRPKVMRALLSDIWSTF